MLSNVPGASVFREEPTKRELLRDILPPTRAPGQHAAKEKYRAGKRKTTGKGFDRLSVFLTGTGED